MDSVIWDRLKQWLSSRLAKRVAPVTEAAAEASQSERVQSGILNVIDQPVEEDPDELVLYLRSDPPIYISRRALAKHVQLVQEHGERVNAERVAQGIVADIADVQRAIAINNVFAWFQLSPEEQERRMAAAATIRYDLS